MRTDAANLLTRLSRNDFRYREFSDAFADMELWPIFEALLTDDCIVGKPLSALAAREAEEAAKQAAKLAAREASPAAPVRLVPEHAAPAPATEPVPGGGLGNLTGNLFAAYAQPADEASVKGDLRGFLRHLSSHQRELDQ